MGSIDSPVVQPRFHQDAATRWRWSVSILDIAPRAVADFITVHMAMLAALALVTLELRNLTAHSVHTVITPLREYYQAVFCPLSLVFPCLYAATGLYTAARAFSIPIKLRRAASSAAVGALALLLASFLFDRSDGLLRTTVLISSALIIVATPGIRWLKYMIFESDVRRGRLAAGPRGDTILVVGGAGYIGSILVRKLLERGYRVRVLDNLVYGDRAIRDLFGHARLEFIKGDSRNMQDVVGAMVGIRSVVDLAAIVGDPACDQDHKTAREINYAATRMMIEIAKGEGVERFVFASSCSVYGASDQVMDEDSEVHPISLYAETKVDSEQALLSSATDRFHPTILRFSTIFGLSPRPRFDLVVNLLTAKAMQEGIVTIYNGQQWRPFLHVADAAETIVLVLDAPVSVVGHQIYNVGDDRLNYCLADLGRKILEVFPGTRIQSIDNSDRRDYRVSFQKIHSQLGFSCSLTLEDGIRELKAAFSDGRISDYRDPWYSNVKFLQEHGPLEPNNGTAEQVMAALSQKACAAR